MYRHWIPGVLTVGALVGCGSSQTTNQPPTAQPVALQSITTVAKPKAKHAGKAHVHKQTVSTTPVSTPAQPVQTATVATAPPATTAAPQPVQAPAPVAATPTTTQPTTVASHKHKKKSTGTSAGGTGLNSQGY